jgi:peroxiredoxin
MIGCSPTSPKSLEEGPWRLTFEIGNERILPIHTTVDSAGAWHIYNSDEEIIVDEITIVNDSIYLRPPVFEGYFAGVFDGNDRISGQYVKPSLDRVVDFDLVLGDTTRFENKNGNDQSTTLQDTWEVVFSPDTADSYIAKGSFSQDGDHVMGTFETTTGDYRYLEGSYEGNKLLLSTFDGAHLFLFEATIKDDKMQGNFYSGSHWQEPFTGVANSSYQLPDATSLTYLKTGYDTIEFEFPDASGKLVSLDDSRFEDKVVIVQLLGSWCPNCLDETRFYVDYLERVKPDDVEIIGLAFEYAPTANKARESIQRMMDREQVPYPILLAQHGNVDKNVANEKLPMLEQLLSYPTSIFIDKAGEVRRIHTGFSGPATGAAYDRFTQDFESLMQQLRSE